MILNLGVSIVIMARVVLGDGSPSKITLYIPVPSLVLLSALSPNPQNLQLSNQTITIIPLRN